MHQSTTLGNNGATGRAVDTATRSAHDAIDKLSSAVKPAVDRLASSAHGAVEKFAGSASDTVETLTSKASRLKEGPMRAAENCRGYVRERPLVSIAIAVAAGLLLSKLLASR